jgi:hypothetical protein
MGRLNLFTGETMGQVDERTRFTKVVDGCAESGYTVGSIAGRLLKNGFKAFVKGTELVVIGGGTFISAAAGGASESFKKKDNTSALPLKFRRKE